MKGLDEGAERLAERSAQVVYCPSISLHHLKESLPVDYA
jgi:cytosine/adenosine deaminase-related metal-dependent hydrolase